MAVTAAITPSTASSFGMLRTPPFQPSQGQMDSSTAMPANSGRHTRL